MRCFSRRLKLCLSTSLVLVCFTLEHVCANDVVLMSYGGHNETIGPYWVAVDKGLYQKHGIDARLLQVRNAQISLTALVSGEVPIFLPSIENVLSDAAEFGACGHTAFPINARVNPKIAQIDVNEAINLSVVKALEESGYLAEAKKRVALSR